MNTRCSYSPRTGLLYNPCAPPKAGRAFPSDPFRAARVSIGECRRSTKMAGSSPAPYFSGSRILASFVLLFVGGQAFPLPFVGLGSTARGERAKERPDPIDALIQRANVLRS